MNPFSYGPGRVYIDDVYVGLFAEGEWRTESEDFCAFLGGIPFRTILHHELTLEVHTAPGMTSDRPDWREYFLGIARAVSRRGDCSRRQVGAVVVDKENRIVSSGFNGTHPGGPSCLAGECPRAQSDVEPGSSYDTGPGACHASHAESNALLYAGRAGTKGSTLYLTTNPCDGCLKLIKAAGIKKVVWPDGVLRKKDLYG